MAPTTRDLPCLYLHPPPWFSHFGKMKFEGLILLSAAFRECLKGLNDVDHIEEKIHPPPTLQKPFARNLPSFVGGGGQIESWNISKLWVGYGQQRMGLGEKLSILLTHFSATLKVKIYFVCRLQEHLQRKVNLLRKSHK